MEHVAAPLPGRNRDEAERLNLLHAQSARGLAQAFCPPEFGSAYGHTRVADELLVDMGKQALRARRQGTPCCAICGLGHEAFPEVFGGLTPRFGSLVAIDSRP